MENVVKCENCIYFKEDQCIHHDIFVLATHNACDKHITEWQAKIKSLSIKSDFRKRF